MLPFLPKFVLFYEIKDQLGRPWNWSLARLRHSLRSPTAFFNQPPIIRNQCDK